MIRYTSLNKIGQVWLYKTCLVIFFHKIILRLWNFNSLNFAFFMLFWEWAAVGPGVTLNKDKLPLVTPPSIQHLQLHMKITANRCAILQSSPQQNACFFEQPLYSAFSCKTRMVCKVMGWALLGFLGDELDFSGVARWGAVPDDLWRYILEIFETAHFTNTKKH